MSCLPEVGPFEDNGDAVSYRNALGTIFRGNNGGPKGDNQVEESPTRGKTPLTSCKAFASHHGRNVIMKNA